MFYQWDSLWNIGTLKLLYNWTTSQKTRSIELNPLPLKPQNHDTIIPTLMNHHKIHLEVSIVLQVSMISVLPEYLKCSQELDELCTDERTCVSLIKGYIFLLLPSMPHNDDEWQSIIMWMMWKRKKKSSYTNPKNGKRMNEMIFFSVSLPPL